MLHRLVLDTEVVRQLILVARLVSQLLYDPGTVWSASASSQKKPEQPPELRLVVHLVLEGLLHIYRF